MVAVSVVLTLFAGPLYAYSERAGEMLTEPAQIVKLVLEPDEDSRLGGGSGRTVLDSDMGVGTQHLEEVDHGS